MTGFTKTGKTIVAKFPGKCVPPFQLRSALSTNRLSYLCNLHIGSRTSIVRLSGIICIIGIASSEVKDIEELIESGMNVACLDFNHGSVEYHKLILENIRQASKNYDKKLEIHCPISIALRLKGHIIRCFPLGSYCIEITLYEEHTVKITGNLDTVTKDTSRQILYVNYGNIHKVVQVGGSIIIGNKQVELICTAIEEDILICQVTKGGDVRSGKRVYLPGAFIDFSLTVHDIKALHFVVDHNIDIIFVPFVRAASAVNEIREFLKIHNINVMVCSEIDNIAAVTNVDEIIKASDGILLNRGGLWNELDLAKNFLLQKSIIAKCNHQGKPVVCMAYFLKSMSKNPQPTHGEIFDFANVILDGVDCVMIHHETSSGDYASSTIQTAARICKQAEAAVWQKQLIHDLTQNKTPPLLTIEALTGTTVLISLGLLASAIVVISASFKSAEIITQSRPKCPVIVVTRNAEKARRSHLFRGIIPLLYKEERVSKWLDDVEARVFYGINFGRKKGFIRAGDSVVVMTSSKQGSGFADQMRIFTVTKHMSHGNECIC